MKYSVHKLYEMTLATGITRLNMTLKYCGNDNLYMTFIKKKKKYRNRAEMHNHNQT